MEKSYKKTSNCSYMKNAINKYGVNNFKIEEIDKTLSTLISSVILL